MAAVAQILIEVDDTAAISAFKTIGDVGGKIGPSLQTAKPAMDNLAKSTSEAREAAALLGEEIGTNIPRGLRNVLAANSVIAPALQAAFSGAVVAGFVTFVKDAVDNLIGFSEQLDAIKKQNDSMMESVASANKALMGPQTLKQMQIQIAQTAAQIRDFNQQLGLTGDAIHDALIGGLTRFSPAAANMLAQLQHLNEVYNQQYEEVAKLKDEQNRLEPIQIQQQLNAAAEAGLQGIRAINQAESDQVRLVRMNVAANVTTEAVGQAQITAAHAKGAGERKLYSQSEWDTTRSLAHQAVESSLQGVAVVRQAQQNAIDDQKTLLDRGLIDTETFVERKRSIIWKGDNEIKLLEIQNANEIAEAQSQAAVALVPPWQRSYAQIQADTQNKLRQIQEELDVTKIDAVQAAELSAAAWQVNFARTRDQLANDMESFFDDITSGNIGQRFKKMFEDIVFQMVATWILGMNSMRSAAATGFGGGPTGILASLFGFGGGGGGGGGFGITGIGGTAPFSGLFGGVGGSVPDATLGDLSSLGLVSGLGGLSDTSSSVPLAGLGLSAGGGIGLGTVLPSGSATGSAIGGIGGLLGRLGGLGGIGGLMALGGGALLGNGNTLVRSLGGLLTGGGLGLAISTAIAGTSIGAALGAFGALLGPIGALAGFLIPLIMGLFGPHKGDIARVQVMEPLMANIKTIENSYDVFQTDYNSAVSQLETLRTQSIAALKKIGGKQVKGNTASTNKLVDDAEAYLKTTEAERQRRAQTQFGPAQFHDGGFVHPVLAGIVPGAFRAGAGVFHSGGEVPAVLEAGEYVMRRAAVNRIGVGTLNAMNSGGAGGVVHYHIHLNAMDAKSFRSWLNAGGTKEIALALRQARREGMRG